MRLRAAAILLLAAATAYASGSITVTGYPAVPRTLKGGTGINIGTDGTFTATGDVQMQGVITFENISGALQGKYVPVSGAAVNTNAYKGNSAPSATEFSYLQGVTSAIQTQLNGKADNSSLALVATTGAYANLSGKPPLSTVATTGAYSDLTGKPTLSAVAGTGAYADLTGKPALATVATTGDYTDLANKPTIPAAQVNADWNASSGVAKINNKPTLATVATTGNYGDLAGKPAAYTLPTATTTVLGGVKVDGSSIQIDGGGVIHATVASGVSSVAGYTGDVTLNTGDITGLTAALAAKSPIASPTFTGTVTAPSITATTGITTPTLTTDAVTSSAADNTHVVQPYNSTSCPTASTWPGGFCSLPAAPYWSNGSSWSALQLALGLSSISGNTTKAATVSGALTAGKQATFDANGNIIASAYATGASGGAGTVNSGTQYHLPWYGTTGTTVSDSGIILASDATSITTVQGTNPDTLTLRPGSASGTSGVSLSVVNSAITPYTLQFPATSPSSGQVPIFGTKVGQTVPVTWGANGSGGSMPTGSAGIPNYNGAGAWGTNYNASNQIPFNFLSGVQAAGSYLSAITDSLSTSSSTTAASANAVKSAYEYATTKPDLTSNTPAMNGSAAVGVASTAARADHVHPSDTTKLDKTNPTYTGTLGTTNADGTHYGLFYNSTSFTGTPSEGMLYTDSAGKLWQYHSSAWVEKVGSGTTYTLPTATTSVLGGVKVDGSTITISGGVISAMAGSVSSTGLILAGLSGNQTVKKGFAYIASGNFKATFGNYSSGIATVSSFGNYSGRIVPASGAKFAWNNPVTFTNNTTSAGYSVKVPPNSSVTLQSLGAGTYYATATRNLQKTGVNEYAVAGGGAAYSDNFNRADQNPLRNGVNTASTPTGTWAATVTGSDIKILSQQVLSTGALTGVYWNANTVAANQSSQVTVVTNDNGFTGPAVRMSQGTGGTLSGYIAYVTYGDLIIRRYVNGTATQIGGTVASGQSMDGKTFKLSATGTGTVTLKVYVNGVQVGSDVTDSSGAINSGQPGLVSSGGTLDSWTGAEI